MSEYKSNFFFFYPSHVSTVLSLEYWMAKIKWVPGSSHQQISIVCQFQSNWLKTLWDLHRRFCLLILPKQLNMLPKKRTVWNGYSLEGPYLLETLLSERVTGLCMSQPRHSWCGAWPGKMRGTGGHWQLFLQKHRSVLVHISPKMEPFQWRVWVPNRLPEATQTTICHCHCLQAPVAHLLLPGQCPIM